MKYLLVVLLWILSIAVFAQLNGVYTIGGVTPDYVNIASAQADLNVQGANAPVTFNIRAGDYSSSITSFIGMNYSYPIVFQSESQNPVDVILDVNVFHESRNIVLNAVTVYPNSNSGSGGFNYKGMDIHGSINITISNCILQGKIASNYRNGISLVRSESHKLINNLFQDLDNAISFSSSTYYGSDRHNGLNIVQGCTFDSCETGLRVMGEIRDTLDVFDNTFMNSGIGIKIDGCDHISIHHNNMYRMTNYAIYINNTPSSGYFPVKVYNNMISGGYSTGMSISSLAQGNMSTSFITSLYIKNTRYAEIYNNSVYGGVRLYNGDNILFKNNCIASDSSLLFSIDSQSSNFISSNNNYYREDDSTIYVTNSYWYNSLDSVQTLTLYEQNSVSTNPLYNSTIDLHATHPLLQYAGINILNVVNDIDYEVRNTTPDIGADEFNSSALPPYAYFSHPCSGGTLNVDFTDMTVRPGNYSWDFGDGVTSTIANPSHLFTTNGTHWVTLIVNNPYGTHQWSDSVVVDTTKEEIQMNGIDLFLMNNYTNYQWYLNGNPIPNETSHIYTPLFNGLYTVSYEDVFGCIFTASDVNFVVGIDDVQIKDNIRIYPNPTTSYLTIEMNSPIENVIILDHSGKIIKSTPFIKKTINVEDLSQGIYFIKLISKKDIIFQKFIKK